MPFFFFPFFFFFLGNGLTIKHCSIFGYILLPGLYSKSSGRRIAFYRVSMLNWQLSLARRSFIDSISRIYSWRKPSALLRVGCIREVGGLNYSGSLGSGSSTVSPAPASSGTGYSGFSYFFNQFVRGAV